MDEQEFKKLTPESEATQPESASPIPGEVISQQTETETQRLVKPFPQEKKGSKLKTVIIVFSIILAGVGSGYLLSLTQGVKSQPKSAQEASEKGLEVGNIFGSVDEKTFRDQAEGVLIKGGVDGEGSHHLLRPGGKSQNVYLTSSIVDLDLFVDHRVKVWGETFSAQKAGWLMDVGRVEVLELNAQKPFEE